MSYWAKSRIWMKWLFPNHIWKIKTTEKKVFLTFDDGPTPEITNWVLAQLKSFNAKASFFCIGDNIQKFPEIVSQILKHNHSVGNHTFNHLNGWKTETEKYVENTELCQKELEDGKWKKEDLQTKTYRLFRPPYGKIKPSQSKKLRKMGYKIVMWDIISYDFNQTITKEKCLENVLKNIENGSIIVFHDSQKSWKNLEYVLPKTLEFLKEKGFSSEKII